MNLGMIGNFVMGVAGVTAGLLSNSNAILLDGLFSAIGFMSALLGLRISQRLAKSPDKFRPLGYAAEEALFATFRSLTILGVILFALGSAATAIFAYLMHGEVRELIFAPVFIYFAFIGVVCLLLWAVHHRNWVLTGRQSDILRLEAKAAVFDGLLTNIAAVGLTAIYIFRDGPLAFIAPIGDSLVVLFLCLAVIGHFWKDFIAGMGELAGATARPEVIATARRAARPVLAAVQGRIRDFTVVKFGRSHLVSVYYDPGRPIEARAVDQLQKHLTQAIRQEIQGADVVVLVSERPRSG